LREAEQAGDYTRRLALLEEIKAQPWGAIWDEFCSRSNVPAGAAWIDDVGKYEKDVLAKRC
jgi:L-rhamnose isomerase